MLAPLRLLLLAALGLASCSAPATTAGMTLGRSELSRLEAQGALLSSKPPIVVRDVTGGSSTSSTGSPRIASGDLRAALTYSLEHVGSPSTVETDEPPLVLDAELLGTESPPGARDMPAYVTVRYRVFPAGSNEPVYDDTIRTGYVVPREDAFTGVERLHLALEGATRDNIVALVRGLASEL